MTQSPPPSANGPITVVLPDSTEVVPKAKRRSFSAAYKQRILQEADRCRQSGELGALLRREGLYSSHLTTWRRQRDQGELGAKKRGPTADPQAKEIARLHRQIDRLQAQLGQAETIIEVQKNSAPYLDGLPKTAPRPTNHDRPSPPVGPARGRHPGLSGADRAPEQFLSSADITWRPTPERGGAASPPLGVDAHRASPGARPAQQCPLPGFGTPPGVGAPVG